MALGTDRESKLAADGSSMLDASHPPLMTEGNLSFSTLDLLRTMALAREGDRREGILYRQGKGWLQVPGTGHEALAALVHCLTPQDYIYPYYRQRAMMLARGISNYSMALAFFAKRDSVTAGRQMCNHYSDFERHVVVSATLTGLQCLPAAGTAWACQREGKGSVVICCIGDAAVRQGEFYEALCLALQENLPLIMLVEDNAYGISTPTARMTPWNIHALSEQLIVHLNGRDALEVYQSGRAAVARARAGGGPTVIWAGIDRLLSHTASDDQRVYRPAREIEEMFLRDPINLLRDELIRHGALTAKLWETIVEEISQQVTEDYE
ncbi:MAG: thiamine pyrophosphate-dependent dehydrogenase E1 component subunit alpha, partial [Armatimonadota bacterium]|nr:thiamine pyrophosphate-dependent dehydrogenase E1 component subunit alpha [Armatimonadota bacterium]